MSRDLWVMFHPTAAYSHLFAQPAGRGSWVFVRRPLFVALLLGCTVSLLTTRSLNARLVLSSMVAFAFVPLAEIASLMAVWLASRSSPTVMQASESWPAAVDLFFTGHAPWSLWLIGFGAFWSSVPHSEAFMVAFWVWTCSMCAIVAWCCYIDLCFFRCISTRPGRSLFLQRAISWSVFVGVWCGGALPADVLGGLGL